MLFLTYLLLLLLIAVFLLGWSISIFLKGYAVDLKSINTIVRTLAPLWIILALYWLSIAIVKIRLVPTRHKMTKEYLFGLYKKEFTLSSPLEVSVSTNYQNGKRIGSDVRVKTPQKPIKIRTFRNSEKIDPFINELKSLFAVNTAC